MRMVITPFQRPALLLFEFKHTAPLRIDLKYIQYTSDIDESKPCAITVDADDEGKWLPEEFALLGYVRQGESP